MRKMDVPIPIRRNEARTHVPSTRMQLTDSDIYAVPQEHLDFRDTIRQIVTERIAPRAAEIDKTGEYPSGTSAGCSASRTSWGSRSPRSTAAPAPGR